MKRICDLDCLSVCLCVSLSIYLAKLGGLSQFVSLSPDYGHCVIGRIKPVAEGGDVKDTAPQFCDPINFFKAILPTAKQIIFSAYNLDETYK